MKTNIYFKAKRKKDGEWVSGNYGKSYFGYGASGGDIVDTISTLQMNDQKKLEVECWEIKPETLCQFTGLIDTDGVEIYGDDLRTDGEHMFRIYQVNGGFAIKAEFWWTNIKDLTATDEFILQPISNPQLAGWLIESTTAAGNYHDLNINQ